MIKSHFQNKVTSLFIFLFLISISSSDSLAQRKDTSDYFAVGVTGGFYFGRQTPLYPVNDYFNSVALEFEYYKFSDLSIYFQGIYQFTGNDIGRIDEHGNEEIISYPDGKPLTYNLNISFGGKYYLRNKNVNPFLELGLNHEYSYIGPYTAVITNENGSYSYSTKSRYYYNLSVNAGVGLSVKLNQYFKIEMNYDIYKSIRNRYSDDLAGYSFLLGLKYNLIK